MSMYSDGCWSPADAFAMIGGNRNNGDGGLFGGEGMSGLLLLSSSAECSDLEWEEWEV